MESVYTQDQIKEAWAEYHTKKVMKILKDGKWTVHKLKPGLRNIEGTKASIVTVNEVMGFPKFLETVYSG